MNVSILNRCNMSCEFCFQKDYLQSHKQVMSVKEFERIAEWSKAHTVGLMGGEATLHPQFIDICEIALKKIGHIKLMTNLSMSMDVLDYIIQKPKHINFLINGNCHTVKNFDTNMNVLLNECSNHISLGYTVGVNTVPEDYQHIIEYTGQDKRQVIKDLRFSFDVSPLANKDWVYDPNKAGKNLVEVLTLLKNSGVVGERTLGLDCAVNACYLNMDTLVDVESLFPKIGYKKECEGVSDILPDGKAAFCSNFIMRKDSPYLINDIYKFKDFYDLKHSFSSISKNKVKTDGCQTCDQTYMCKGFCPALTEHFKG